MCAQWINMSLVINHFLDQQSLEDEIYGRASSNTTNKETPELVMPFWDWCVESDDEKIEEILVGDSKVVKGTASKGYNFRNKVTPSKNVSPKGENMPLMKITPPHYPPKIKKYSSRKNY